MKPIPTSNILAYVSFVRMFFMRRHGARETHHVNGEVGGFVTSRSIKSGLVIIVVRSPRRTAWPAT